MSTSKGCASASRMGTSSSGCRRHNLTFPPIPSFWHVTCPSSSISCFDFWDRKNTQTWQQGCVSSHTLLSNQRKDPSHLLHNLQDPRSRYLQDYLQDNKEFICLRLTVPYPVTNMDQNKHELLDEAQKQDLRKREEWIPLSSHFCPQQEQHLSLEKEDVGAGSTHSCLAKSNSKRRTEVF